MDFGGKGCSWTTGNMGKNGGYVGHDWGSFFPRESFDRLRMSGDGEVRGGLHGRIASLWDLGMYLW